MTAGDFQLTCRRCRATLFALGPRLSDDALRMLLEHLRQVHRLKLPKNVDAGAILEHFDVSRTDP